MLMLEREDEPEEPKPTELPAFLPFVCRKLGAPFMPRVHVQTQEDYVSRLETPKKHARRGTSRQPSEIAKVEDSSSGTGTTYEDAHDVLLTVVQDAAARAVELRLARGRDLPAALLRVLALAAPFHAQLARLALRRATLRAPALRELRALLAASRLTELCLDDARVPPQGLDALLAAGTRLTQLSLARCELGDAQVAALCARLAHPLPAACTLRQLHLGSNRMSDAAAPALAVMLRSNRTLRYLNLSGNAFTDAGARNIFSSLREFPLTAEEIADKRVRMLGYLKTRRQVYAKCLRNVMSDKSAFELGRGRQPRKAPARLRRASGVSSMDGVAARAEALTTEMLGEFSDPFSGRETFVRDGVTYCVGNTALCYVNLAYNNLEHASVAELLRVLRHQRWLAQRAGPGLLRAPLDGNALPAACREFELIDELLERLYRAAELAAVKTAKRFDRSKVKSRH